MVNNDPGRISANFGEVEAGAQDILSSARSLNGQLEDLHKRVTDFVNNNWSGQTTAAFTQMQTTWNQKSHDLNQTLNAAATTTSSGNSDLQAKDVSLANLFH